MKNSAVEAMIREQFNLQPITVVKIIFVAFFDNLYEFSAEWSTDDKFHFCYIKIPPISIEVVNYKETK